MIIALSNRAIERNLNLLSTFIKVVKRIIARPPTSIVLSCPGAAGTVPPAPGYIVRAAFSMQQHYSTSETSIGIALA